MNRFPCCLRRHDRLFGCQIRRVEPATRSEAFGSHLDARLRFDRADSPTLRVRSIGRALDTSSSTPDRPPAIDSAESYRADARRLPASSGATAAIADRARRAPRKSRKRSSMSSRISFFDQLLIAALRARSSALAVRKTLSSASGNTTVPMSRPSATSPGGRRESPLQRSSAVAHRRRARRRARPAALTASARMASVTSAPSSSDALAGEARVERRAASWRAAPRRRARSTRRAAPAAPTRR